MKPITNESRNESTNENESGKGPEAGPPGQRSYLWLWLAIPMVVMIVGAFFCRP